MNRACRYLSKDNGLVVFFLALSSKHERSRFAVADRPQQTAFEDPTLLLRLCRCKWIARVEAGIAEQKVHRAVIFGRAGLRCDLDARTSRTVILGRIWILIDCDG